jgi:hypothetical protein
VIVRQSTFPIPVLRQTPAGRIVTAAEARRIPSALAQGGWSSCVRSASGSKAIVELSDVVAEVEAIPAR